MSFLIDKYKFIDFAQVNDIRVPDLRLYRNRARGNRSPYFTFEFETPLLSFEERMPLVANAMAYEGPLNLFLLNNPVPMVGPQVSVQSVGAISARGSKQVTIQGNHDYRAGNFVKFSNNTKCYFIERVVSGANTQLFLTHPLLEEVDSGDSMDYGEEVQFQVCITNRITTDIEADNGKFGTINVDLAEQA